MTTPQIAGTMGTLAGSIEALNQRLDERQLGEGSGFKLRNRGENTQSNEEYKGSD